MFTLTRLSDCITGITDKSNNTRNNVEETNPSSKRSGHHIGSGN